MLKDKTETKRPLTQLGLVTQIVRIGTVSCPFLALYPLHLKRRDFLLRCSAFHLYPEPAMGTVSLIVHLLINSLLPSAMSYTCSDGFALDTCHPTQCWQKVSNHLVSSISVVP